MANNKSVRDIKDFESLGKLISVMEKTRDVKKDLEVLGQIKKVIETLSDVKIEP